MTAVSGLWTRPIHVSAAPQTTQLPRDAKTAESGNSMRNGVYALLAKSAAISVAVTVLPCATILSLSYRRWIQVQEGELLPQSMLVQGCAPRETCSL